MRKTNNQTTPGIALSLILGLMTFAWNLTKVIWSAFVVNWQLSRLLLSTLPRRIIAFVLIFAWWGFLVVFATQCGLFGYVVLVAIAFIQFGVINFFDLLDADRNWNDRIDRLEGERFQSRLNQVFWDFGLYKKQEFVLADGNKDVVQFYPDVVYKKDYAFGSYDVMIEMHNGLSRDMYLKSADDIATGLGVGHVEVKTQPEANRILLSVVAANNMFSKEGMEYISNDVVKNEPLGQDVLVPFITSYGIDGKYQYDSINDAHTLHAGASRSGKTECAYLDGMHVSKCKFTKINAIDPKFDTANKLASIADLVAVPYLPHEISIENGIYHTAQAMALALADGYAEHNRRVALGLDARKEFPISADTPFIYWILDEQSQLMLMVKERFSMQKMSGWPLNEKGKPAALTLEQQYIEDAINGVNNNLQMLITMGLRTKNCISIIAQNPVQTDIGGSTVKSNLNRVIGFRTKSATNTETIFGEDWKDHSLLSHMITRDQQGVFYSLNTDGHSYKGRKFFLTPEEFDEELRKVSNWRKAGGHLQEGEFTSYYPIEDREESGYLDFVCKKHPRVIYALRLWKWIMSYSGAISSVIKERRSTVHFESDSAGATETPLSDDGRTSVGVSLPEARSSRQTAIVEVDSSPAVAQDGNRRSFYELESPDQAAERIQAGYCVLHWMNRDLDSSLCESEDCKRRRTLFSPEDERALDRLMGETEWDS